MFTIPKRKHTYKLVRSRRKTLALAVNQSLEVVVRAPKNLSLDLIENFVSRKADWIDRAVQKMSLRSRPIIRRYEEGEEFLFLGASYRLFFSLEVKKPCLQGSLFLVPARYRGGARKAVIDFYKEQAKDFIFVRAKHFSLLSGLVFRSLKINHAKGRWGSCSLKGDINFSLRLMMTPPEVLDYVIIHELVHLEHPNHSVRFWNRVGSLCPKYSVRQRWLREQGAALYI